MNAKGLVSFAGMKDFIHYKSAWLGISLWRTFRFWFGAKRSELDYEFVEMSYNIVIKIGEREKLTSRI